MERCLEWRDCLWGLLALGNRYHQMGLYLILREGRGNQWTKLRLMQLDHLEHHFLEHRCLEHHFLEHHFLGHRFLEHHFLEHHFLEHHFLGHRFLERHFLEHHFLERHFLEHRFLGHQCLEHLIHCLGHLSRYLEHLIQLLYQLNCIGCYFESCFQQIGWQHWLRWQWAWCLLQWGFLDHLWLLPWWHRFQLR